ncbi:GatB/YqeY domain-containing protein [Agaribacter marinus]|uniref:Aspartyl-tRNA amidotransferase subunit B n=1 Tax=Agaribacter marinus TaxID=1431249 RepID=A0AA37SZG2_9ALTE|nr:GatB/YqeY domain-containing protein [Agaribacter marinus]GLR71184.1 aspartyl-tRNA amidotransferase subunit B [Agaribacter marinus]
MSLLETLKSAQKDAMRAKDKLTLGTIRMALAAVKQKEVDERVEVTEQDVLQILTKMVKQRQEAASQFVQGERQDLADKEHQEIDVLKRFLPAPLSEDEIAEIIEKAVADAGATNIKDMGKVMGIVRPQVQGKADMGKVSGLIKSKLA